FGSRLQRRLRVEDIHPSTPGPRIPRRDRERAGHHAGGALEPATGRGRRRRDCGRRGRHFPDAAEAMTTRRSISVVLALFAAGLVLFLAPAAAQGPIFGRIEGANTLAPGQVSAYNLTIEGGPTGAVTYTVRWYLTGPNVAGGVPTASPMTTTGNRTTFRLNIT